MCTTRCDHGHSYGPVWWWQVEFWGRKNREQTDFVCGTRNQPGGGGSVGGVRQQEEERDWSW